MREHCASAAFEFDYPGASRGLKGGYSSSFYRSLAAKGWLGLQLPRRYGGQERDWIFETILAEELGRANAPAGNYAGTVLEFGNLVLRYGSETLKQDLLPRIVRGEVRAGHLYTEPEAGTDLSAVRTRAVARGDEFVVSGQKMYASEVHRTEYSVLLARTDVGPSMFVLDGKAKGMAHHKLPTLGGKGTNHLFLEDVRIPRAHLIGEEGRGFEYLEAIRLEYWAKNQGYLSGAMERALAQVVDHVRGRAIAANPLVRDRIARVATRVRAVRLLSHRLAAMASADDPGAPALLAEVKVLTDDSIVVVGDELLRLLGPDGQLAGASPHAPFSGTFENAYRENALKHFSSLGASFARNDVAAYRLGLPDATTAVVARDERGAVRRAARALLTRESRERVWSAMTRAGWTGWIYPEGAVGAGGTYRDLAVLLEEHGRACATTPFIATLLSGLAIVEAGTLEQRERLLPALERGALFAFAVSEPDQRHESDPPAARIERRGDRSTVNGTKILVAHAAAAESIVVVARSDGDLAFAVVDAKGPGVRITPTTTIGLDERCEVAFDGAPVNELIGGAGDRAAALGRVLDGATVALCAEMVGATERVVEMTATHLRARSQFGAPLADLQLLRHRAADAAIALDAARALTDDAAARIDRGLDVSTAASMAKAWTNEAYRLATWTAMQIHGGAGFLADHPLGLFYRRAKAADVTFGDSDHHHAQVAESLLGPVTEAASPRPRVPRASPL